MLAAGLMAEGIAQISQIETAVDHRAHPEGFKRRDKVDLMLARPDDQTLKPLLLAHQCGSWNVAADPRENANQCDVGTGAPGVDGLRQSRGTTDFYHQINTPPVRQALHLGTPVRRAAIVDDVICPHLCQTRKFLV